MAPILLPQHILTEEQIAAARANPVLTPAQLHLLWQQIEKLRRINVQLRALKYKARTGKELQQRASGGGQRGGRGGRGGRGSRGGTDHLIVVRGRGRGRSRGRGRGTKRGREDEEEDDDSIVVRTSDEEEEAGDSEADTEEGEDGGSSSSLASDESAQSADSSVSEDDWEIPKVQSPRRSVRVRRPASVSAAAAGGGGGSEDGSASEGEEEGEEEEGQAGAGTAPEPAGPDADAEGEEAVAAEDRDGDTGRGGAAAAHAASQPRSAAASASPSKQARSSKAGAGAGAGARSAGGDGGATGSKRRGLFMVVSEDTAASGAGLQLPQLKPVVPSAAGSKQQEEEDEEMRDAEDAEDEEDAVCDVCGDADAVEGNAILLCDGKGCSVAVHQACYGVAKVPAGKWLCDGCKAKLKPTDANCCVCPVVGGAVKKVTSLGRVVPASQGAKGKGTAKGTAVYCHLACVLWVPELELGDHAHMAAVKLDKLTAVRAKLKCELCKQAGGGAVQCAFGTCCRSFHVLCARAAKQTLTFRATDGEPLAFCQLHSRPTFDKMVEEMVDGKRPLQLHGAALHDEAGE